MIWWLLLLALPLRAGEIRIRGNASELKTARVELHYAGSVSEIWNHRSVRVPVDAEGNFDVSFPLERPAYYSVGTNLLYLSPGDDLRIVFSRSSTRTHFEGKGSEANNYLKGWRWNDSRNLGMLAIEAPPVEQVIERVDSLAGKRLRELSALANSSRHFRRLERARIAANRISVYFNCIYRTDYYRWNDTPEIKEEKKIAYYRTLKEKVEPLLRRIDRDDDFLECPAVREVLLECCRSGVFDFRVSKILAELADAILASTDLDAGIREADMNKHRERVSGINTPAFREALEAKLAARTRLIEGQPAVDIALRDFHGNLSRLSDHRGKVLFIDFWATWCLPCLAQAPHVKALSEKYPRIEFIAISIDREEEKWRGKLERDGEQATIKGYIANVEEALDAWDIATIPRFILIDENFKIITAFAPRPSDRTAIESLLEGLH
jgi:thiol-disulfide isomerase/thioredoxin